MAIEQEHVKWIREKRNALYADLLPLFDLSKWRSPSEPDDTQWAELERVNREALLYATDDVLESVQTLSKAFKDKRDSHDNVITAQTARSMTMLVRNIRSELAGPYEASKTWRRYDRSDAAKRRTAHHLRSHELASEMDTSQSYDSAAGRLTTTTDHNDIRLQSIERVTREAKFPGERRNRHRAGSLQTNDQTSRTISRSFTSSADAC